jgi:glycosyltransferase involved in cell wall biosynthesis
VGQAALAGHFRAAAFLVYPSTYIETYCIVAQEALAAGLKVISNDFGALPETTMGYADLFAVANGTVSRQAHVEGITALLDKNESLFLKSPKEWAQERFAQVQAVNRFCTWPARAAEWEGLLASQLRN